MTAGTSGLTPPESGTPIELSYQFGLSFSVSVYVSRKAECKGLFHVTVSLGVLGMSCEVGNEVQMSLYLRVALLEHMDVVRTGLLCPFDEE